MLKKTIMKNRLSKKRKHDASWYLCLIYYTLLNSMGFFVGDTKIGAILIISLILLMLLYHLIKNSWRIKLIKGQKYIIVYLIVFSFFCLLSAKWAVDRNYAITQGINMFEISFATLVIYLLFQSKDSIDDLLEIVMYGGLFFCLIVALFYGPVGLAKLFIEGGRVSEIANANSLADYCLFSSLAVVYFYAKNKNKKILWLLLPLGFMTILAGSRKVLISLIAAILLFSFFNSLGDKSKIKTIVKILGALLFVGAAIYIASLIPSLHFIFVKVESMIDTFLGKDTSDSSTITRLRLQEIGIEIFQKHPYFGIGIDNAGIYGGIAYGLDKYYMHNNYVELLADVGIVGTLLYYSIYIIMLAKMLIHRRFHDRQFNILLTILLIHLFLDIGNVSYIDKTTYIYLIPIWIKACSLKKQNKAHKKPLNTLNYIQENGGINIYNG